MKMKRFLAPDIRQALQQVKEALGPDAVILSNRKTEEGVEIVAARDFELETLAVSKKAEAAKGQPARVTPKPAFSAQGYRAVAEMVAPQAAKPPTKSNKATSKPDFSLIDRVPATPENEGSRSIQAATKPSLGNAAESRDTNHRSQPLAEQPKPATPDNHRWEAVQSELQQMRRLLDRHLSRQTWREVTEQSPTRLDILRTLNELGFSRELSRGLAQACGSHESIDRAWAEVGQALTQQLSISDDSLLEYGGIAALVGPTGVGKTTTIAKLAAKFRLKHGPRQIALVTTDNYRIAAHEQLSTYARILGVPFRVANTPEELQGILRSFVNKKLVLIDTAGMSQKDRRLADQFALFQNKEIDITTYLVLSASSQHRTLHETMDAFSSFQARSCILTKLDEAGSLAPALSALLARKMPVAYVADGQQVPENLHRARAQDLIDRSLVREAAEAVVAESAFGFEDWIIHASA